MHLKSTAKPRARLSRDESQLQTKQLLREAALRQFALHGVAGTSAERIADAAGFTRGAFYANFPNKEAMLLDLLAHKMAAESPNWVRLAEESADIEQTLREMGERAGQFDPDGLWALIGIETYLCALRDPKFALEYKQYHDGIQSVCCLFLSRMFERAGKVPAASYEDLADLLLAMSMSINLPNPVLSERAPSSRATDMLIVVLRGLLAAAQPVADTQKKRTSKSALTPPP